MHKNCMFCHLSDILPRNKLLQIVDDLGGGATTTSYAHVRCIIDASFICSEYEDLKSLLRRMLN